VTGILAFARVMMLCVGAWLALWTTQAAAQVSGSESFRGQIIAPEVSGSRHVTSSIVVASGVFVGVGRIVEVANRPGDPDNVSRDDLVFPAGRLHIRNASQAPELSVNHKTCALTAVIKQTTTVQGGTGKFRRATGTFRGVVRAWAVARRSANGICNLRADTLLDADAVSGQGDLRF
jgi:hypothetical protein